MTRSKPANEPGSWLVAVALGALVFALYGRTLGFGFVYDDTWTILENAVIRDPANLLRLWAPALVHEGVPDAARPLMLASLMLDFVLWGHDPAGYHLTNVLLHLAVVLLFFRVLWRLFGARWLAAIAAAVFAVHPLGTEVVAAINYREDLLALAFLLLGLLALGLTPIAGTGSQVASGGLSAGSPLWRWGRRGLAAVAVAAAALSKESGYLAPLVFLALELCAVPAPSGWAPTGGGQAWLARFSRRAWDHAAVWAAVLAVLAWRTAILASPLRVSLSAETPTDRRIATALAEGALTFWQSVAAFLWPVGLAPEYPDLPRGIWALLAGWLAVFGIVAWLALSGYLRRRCPPAAVGLWLAAIGYLPHLGFVALTNQRADRYAYFPALGFSLAVTAAVVHGLWPLLVQRRGRASPGTDSGAGRGVEAGWTPRGRAGWTPIFAVAAVLVLLAGRTTRQVRLWRSDATVFAAATARAPGSQRAWIGLAYAQLAQGQSLEALAAARRALELAPSARAHEALGVVLARQGAHPAARTEFAAALAKTAPTERFYRGQLLNNLALVELRLGRPREALVHLNDAKRLAPRLEVAPLNAARAHEALGDVEAARLELRALLAWSPRFLPALTYLGALAEAAGDQAEARRAYENARDLAPEDTEVARALRRLETSGPPPVE